MRISDLSGLIHQGLVAREIAGKLHAAGELIGRMNERLSEISTSHGIGVRLRWRRRDDLDATLAATIDLLAQDPGPAHGRRGPRAFRGARPPHR